MTLMSMDDKIYSGMISFFHNKWLMALYLFLFVGSLIVMLGMLTENGQNTLAAVLFVFWFVVPFVAYYLGRDDRRRESYNEFTSALTTYMAMHHKVFLFTPIPSTPNSSRMVTMVDETVVHSSPALIADLGEAGVTSLINQRIVMLPTRTAGPFAEELTAATSKKN